ncbi:MAG: hypothetical protein V4538_05050 [Bacteroidota bacterium]
MKSNLTIILFLLQFVWCTNCYAQVKEVVFTNKKKGSQEVYKLPHQAEINLIDENPNFFSNVILDSVSNDTFYITNPRNAKQQLAVPFNVVNSIKLSGQSLKRGFRVFHITFLSSLLLIGIITPKYKYDTNIITIPLLLGGVGFLIGIPYTKKYHNTGFEIKGRNK